MVTETGGDPGCYTEHGVSGYGVAIKLTSAEPLDQGRIRSLAEQMMLRIADRCMVRGARCIGHVKCHLTCEAGAVKADTIGGGHVFSTGTVEHPVRDLYLAVNSIVQGIREEEVRGATLDGVHEVAEGQGLTVAREKEHAYFDEFDFTTSKQEYLRQLEEQLGEAPAGEGDSTP